MQAPATIWLLFAFPAVTAIAQDLRSEMERAERFGREAGSLLEHNEVWPYWGDHATRLVYRVNSGRHERQFFQVDLQTGAKAPAFDHAALAKALATAAAREVMAVDEDKRQLLLKVVGVTDQDPYHQHFVRVGFIVVSIDGMGTNWRGKAFQDVCWKNLADSGFPDRIAWIKAAAASRPWMDLTRVGIYGGSAGGQSTLAGLLHHGDFYQVGVADCGCHDNRMDKIWWNEAWMGWPIDDSYARNSNVTHAAKLTGKLLMVVGEIDHNVDPASTAQVAAALQKAGKDFEMLTIMNSDHGAAESPYGKYRRAEFLVRNLHAAAPPPHAN